MHKLKIVQSEWFIDRAKRISVIRNKEVLKDSGQLFTRIIFLVEATKLMSETHNHIIIFFIGIIFFVLDPHK